MSDLRFAGMQPPQLLLIGFKDASMCDSGGLFSRSVFRVQLPARQLAPPFDRHLHRGFNRLSQHSSPV
jgi:hypothetical protein